MEKMTLTIQHLVSAGFRPAGHWKISDRGIRREGVVPACGGVYAFAVQDRVVYIGLASTNLTKRLYFYQNPGATQRTNVRLNGLILEKLQQEQVDVYFACPPDFEWSGLLVKGAEGLEAGLIARFDLPWNMRGNIGFSSPVVPSAAQESIKRSSTATPNGNGAPMQRVLDFIAQYPNRTEAEIAKEVFGRGTPQQKVNPMCRELVKRGRVSRRGGGGAADPFTYVSKV